MESQHIWVRATKVSDTAETADLLAPHWRSTTGLRHQMDFHKTPALPGCLSPSAELLVGDALPPGPPLASSTCSNGPFGTGKQSEDPLLTVQDMLQGDLPL